MSLLSNGFKMSKRAGGVAMTIAPSDDAYVQDSTANTNYGASASLLVKYWPGTYRYSFLRFSLPSYPSASNAKVRLYVTQVIYGFTLSISFYTDAPTAMAWDEATITWNNKPTSLNTLIETRNVVAADVGTWIEIDVTTEINAAFAVGESFFNIRIASNTYHNDKLVYFSSKEGTHSPELIITP